MSYLLKNFQRDNIIKVLTVGSKIGFSANSQLPVVDALILY